MTAINDVVDLANEGDIAVITLNSPPVNALSAKVRDGLDDAFKAAIADPAAKAIVLICAGRTFIAGADISEFGKPPQGRVQLNDLLDHIEASTKPVVCAIHGTALGGGLETALVCHYRVAVPSAKVGMPEVNIGIIPGAGGTQRVPRLIGAAAALEMITSGAPMGAKEAAAKGLIDALVEEGQLREGAIAFAQKVLAGGGALRTLHGVNVEAAPGTVRRLPQGKRRQVPRPERARGRHPGHRGGDSTAARPRPEEGTGAVQRLVTGEQAFALRYVFFAQREAGKIPDVPSDTPVRAIKSVGVIGAGTMGGGIAMNFLNANLPVTLVEVKQEALDRGVAIIRKNYDSSAQKGRMTAEDVEKRMALLSPTLAFDALAACDLIIEAVFEDMAVKKDVFTRLDAIAKPGAILATNTSYLDVNEIAGATGRPQDVIGLHFFSPANIMKLLEIVRGDKTGKDVIATAMQVAKLIGKVAVVVGVAHGFVGNRMLTPRTREANNLVVEGASPWQVDKVLYDFGMPMGPFAMADLAGLDIGWNAKTSSSSTLREVLAEQGRLGQKAGGGFYDYDAARKATPSPITEKAITDFRAKTGVAPREISDQEILERTIYPMINEGAKILKEGKALRASDIDMVWLNGYGWPAWRGGPMYYAGVIGLQKVVGALTALETKYGEAFTPAPLLVKLAAEGKTFADL